MICAALVDGGRPDAVRGWLLELLFQIANGNGPVSNGSDPVEVRVLRDRCCLEARKAVGILYRELAIGVHAAADQVLQVLEADRARAEFISDQLRLKKDSNNR